MNSIANDSNHTNHSDRSEREEMTICNNSSQSKLVVDQKLKQVFESNYSDVITSSYVRGYN